MAAENTSSNYHISRLLQKLQSSSTSSVQKALISLSRATRKSENVVKLREEGGIMLLLTFIQSSNKKALDMAVSILANCALEKQSKTEIKRLNGVAFLCNLLASLADTSILSRVTRALANLSQDLTIATEILSCGAVSKLLGILKESTDVHLLQNTLRSLRIMGRSELCAKELADSNGILNFVDLLHNENSNDIKCSCLQTLLELIKTDNKEIGEQLQENDGIGIISELSFSDDKDIAANCIKILSTITRHSSVRVSVGTMGGIEAFIYHIRAFGALLLPSVEGICMCCREAVSRNKVRSCGGLEVLLDLLRRPGYSQIIDKILGAFVCFMYDELALKRLLAGGLISSLVSILQELLFPNNASKVTPEQQDKDENVATAAQTKDTASISTETALQPTASAITQSNTSGTGGSAKSLMLPLPPLGYTSYPASSSPPNSLSPNLSPELRVSYMSPCSPQSVRSSSPVVFSPSGSEVDDDFSSECSDGNPEPDTMHQDEKQNAEMAHDSSPARRGDVTTSDCNIVAMLKDLPTGEDDTKHSTTTHDYVPSTVLEDLTTSNSGNKVPVSEKKFDETDERVHDSPSSQDDIGSLSGRVPLLPGSGFNEHIHLFLPDENLFSADQPSPRKVKPRPSPISTRRTSSGVSCGSSSLSHGINKKSRAFSKTPDSSPQSPSYSTSLYGVERKIIFLLSRFGQMPDATDAEALTSPECIQTLLDYLCYSKNPDARCVRLLNRIALDRKYFETLVITMFPGAIYRQLVCGLRAGLLLCNQSRFFAGSELDNIVKESSFLTSEPAKPTCFKDTDAIISEQPPEEVLLACGSSMIVEVQKFTKSTKSTLTSDPNLEWSDPATIHNSAFQAASSLDRGGAHGDTMTTAENFLPERTKEIGGPLLSILTAQAGSSFGEGILAHLLLRGTQKQKEACALSLPYLCKSLRLKRRLMVDYKGLLVILSLLRDPTEQANIIRAVDSLTFLVSNSALKMDKDFKLFIGRKSVDKPNLPEKEKSHVLTTGRSSNIQNTDGSSTPNKESGTDVTTEGCQSVEGFPTVADNELSIIGTATGACRETEYVAKANDRLVDTGTTSEGRRSVDGSSTKLLGVREEYMQIVDKVNDLSSDTCQTSKTDRQLAAVIDQDASCSGTVPKRVREVELTDNCSNKKTKLESSSIQLETCSFNCFYNRTHSTPFDVVVKVESGGTMKAHRSVLSAYSEVFAVMLSGDFVEAKQSEIIVKDMSYATVLFLIHYAYGCSWSFEMERDNRLNVCQLLEEYLLGERSQYLQSDDLNFDFLLDLLSSADRFLLTDLKNQCEQLTMYSVTGERVVEAYLAAAFYRTFRLRLYCLQYIFLGNLDPSCVYQCVVNLLESKEKDHLIEDFKNIALDCCN